MIVNWNYLNTEPVVHHKRQSHQLHQFTTDWVDNTEVFYLKIILVELGFFSVFRHLQRK